MTTETIEELVPARIAFIIDGVVADVLNTDDRLAAIFLSQPKVVDVTEISQSEFITSGYLYNEELNTFTRFTVEETPGAVVDAALPDAPIVVDTTPTED
jgi:hypothetical protein